MTFNAIMNGQLSEEEQDKVVFSRIDEIFNWQKGYFVSDNKVKIQKTFFGSHSWTEDIIVREATEDDIVIDKFFKLFNARRRKTE